MWHQGLNTPSTDRCRLTGFRERPTSGTGQWCPFVTRLVDAAIAAMGSADLAMRPNRRPREVIREMILVWYGPCERLPARPVSEPASDHKRQVPVHDDVRLVGGRQSGRSGSATGLTISEPLGLLIRHVTRRAHREAGSSAPTKSLGE